MRTSTLLFCAAGCTLHVADAFPQSQWAHWSPPQATRGPTTTTITSTAYAYVPSNAGSTTTTNTVPPVRVTSSIPVQQPSTSSPWSYPQPSQPSSGSKVRFAGLNIAGFDFGVRITGEWVQDEFVNIAQNDKAYVQMKHFVDDDGLNTFRLPVAWQYLVNRQLGATLDPANFAAYNKLVQDCIRAGAKMCIVDVHNYARWDGMIIGQSGYGAAGSAPTDDHLSSLWWQLAARYANISQVVFDIMNEPHDLDLNAWKTTVQSAIHSIRDAKAINNRILISGTDFAAAGSFVSSGSADVLKTIMDPSGGTEKLIFNVHQYLDANSSGKDSTCVRNNAAAFQSLATWLRQNGRKAMLTETGGGPDDAKCMEYLCEQNQVINDNSDVFLGVVTWAAGAFGSWYEINQTPMRLASGMFKDQPLRIESRWD